jgi:hypothetical protein
MDFSSNENLNKWADWVRASLYLSDFLSELTWEAKDGPTEEVTLSYRSHGGGAPQPFFSVVRPSGELFDKQLDLVRSYMDQRPERTAEITSQLGFPTPYFAMIIGLIPGRNDKTLELITITQVLAAHVAMIVKHHLAIRRPDRIGVSILPMIPTPGHGSFPSAHATEAFAVVRMLEGLIDASGSHYPDGEKRKNLLRKQAERIAVSRTVAGVHYPVDSWAGALLGKLVGEIILNKCGAPADMRGLKYEARAESDFMVSQYQPSKWGAHGVSELQQCQIDQSKQFEWLWKRAVEEFDL